jgi:hypothetical protein
MKRKTVLIIAAAIGLLVVSNSCHTPKSIEAATGAKEVTMGFPPKEYQSDKEYFRAMGSGKSPDKEDARRIADLSAGRQLGAIIKQTIRSSMNDFTQTLSGNAKQDYEQAFNQSSWQFVDQTLTSATVKNEKMFLETDKTYTCYVIKQISTQPILDGVSNQISQDKKLEINYDKKKFAEEIEKEKQQMAEDRKNNK